MNMTARTRLAAVGLAVVVVSVFGAASAGAQEGSDTYVGPTSTVAPEVLNTTDVAPAPQTTAAAEVQGSSLAFTGGDAIGLVLIGGVAVAAGAGLLLARRRQPATV